MRLANAVVRGELRSATASSLPSGLPMTKAPGGAGPSGTPSKADRELMARVRTGDPAALDEVLRLYWEPLVAYLLSHAGSLDAAEDLAQDAFLRFWSRRKRWRSASSPRALVYRIGRNLALDAGKQAWRRVPLADSGAHSTPTCDSPLESAQAGELDVAVRQAIDRLPARRREAFELARFHELSYQEIAETMGLSPQTVANHVSAALSALRVSLRPFTQRG